MVTVSYVREHLEPEDIPQPQQRGRLLANDEVYMDYQKVHSLMAAVGMGGTRLRRGFYRPALGEREARTLEAVRIAVEMGVELNAADNFGRTALEAAKELGYDSVVAFLVESGAAAD